MKELTFRLGRCPICEDSVTVTATYDLNRRGEPESITIKRNLSCPNGHPLEDIMSQTRFGSATDEEDLKGKVRKQWSDGLSALSHVRPCVCGRKPVLNGPFLTCPECGITVRERYGLLELVGDWNERIATDRRPIDPDRGRSLLCESVGMAVDTPPRPLGAPSNLDETAMGMTLLAVWDDLTGHHEKAGVWPFICPGKAMLFDMANLRAHRWMLSDGTAITSMNEMLEPEHGETLQQIYTLTGRLITIPDKNVLYVI